MKYKNTEADELLEKIDKDLDRHSPDYNTAVDELEYAIRLKKSEYGKDAAPLFDLFLDTLNAKHKESTLNLPKEELAKEKCR
jgi:sugar-specific transcriptional regulator TrmB